VRFVPHFQHCKDGQDVKTKGDLIPPIFLYRATNMLGRDGAALFTVAPQQCRSARNLSKNKYKIFSMVLTGDVDNV